MSRPASEDRTLTSILLGLTAVTGVVDAVSYLALGVFTANMTGNVVLLGFAVAGAPGLSVPRSTIALAGFCIGAVLGGRLAAWLHPGPRHRWAGVAFSLEAALLLTAMAIAAGHPSARSVDSAHLYAVITFASVAMGLRGVTVRKLGAPALTTLVLTLTIVDLVGDSWLAGGRGPRWPVQGASVVAMFAGAVVGALLVRETLVLPLALAGTASAVGALAAFLTVRTAPAV